MDGDFEVPAGYMLVKTGGRPQKTARDVGVYLAFLWKKEDVEKTWLAHEYIVDSFKLSDAGHARKCIRNAKKALSKKNLVSIFPNFVLLVSASISAGGHIEVKSGASGWIWANGLPTGLEIVTTAHV